MGVLRKKLKHTVIQKYFFLEILINVKAGRVNSGARKVYHGRRVGQACTTPTPPVTQIFQTESERDGYADINTGNNSWNKLTGACKQACPMHSSDLLKSVCSKEYHLLEYDAV
jgi:hypothetical protein